MTSVDPRWKTEHGWKYRPSGAKSPEERRRQMEQKRFEQDRRSEIARMEDEYRKSLRWKK